MLNACRNIVIYFWRRFQKLLQAHPKKQRQNFAHGVMLVANVFVYGYAISELDGDRELMSAAWREITGEFHPDELKDTERITESEVVPKWKDRMSADDVTKHLNWFQTFCEFKYGMDDHLEFFWMCDIIDVAVVPTDEDFNHADPHMNCSASFIERHMVKGNDPRCVPWGSQSLPQLQKYIEVRSKETPEMTQKEANLSLVDPIFDEYTVHRHNPMWQEPMGQVEEIGSRLSALKIQLSQLESLKHVRRLFGLLGSSRDRPRHGRTAQRRLEGLDCPMRDEPCPYFKDNLTNFAADLQCYCFREKQSQNYNESKDYVLNTCRNHHWGLLMSCAPRNLRVRFHIERIVYRNISTHIQYTMNRLNHHYRRILWFLVDMNFENIASDFEGSGGWFRSTLTMKEGEFYGHKKLVDGIFGLTSLVMLLWFLMRRLVGFFLFCPYRTRRLLMLRNPAIAQKALLEARSMQTPIRSSRRSGALNKQATQDLVLRDIVEARLLMFLDGPGHRAEYLSMAGILFENFNAFFVLLAILSSMFFTGSTVISEDDTFRVMSGREYIQQMLPRDKRFTEGIFEFFYDDVDSHSLAWIALYFRAVFFALGFVQGLRWLPATIILAANRTCYFMLTYGFSLAGFALVFYIRFGGRFVQFSTLPRAIFELVLLTCGNAAHVFDDMYPFQDRGSFYAMVYLSAFVLIAVTIGLNFFITILLDAYTLASDAVAASSLLQAGLDRVTENVMRACGISSQDVDDVLPTSHFCEADLLHKRRSLLRRRSSEESFFIHQPSQCEDPLSRKHHTVRFAHTLVPGSECEDPADPLAQRHTVRVAHHQEHEDPLAQRRTARFARHSIEPEGHEPTSPRPNIRATARQTKHISEQAIHEEKTRALCDAERILSPKFRKHPWKDAR